jgi:hypothetical protein
MGTSLQRTSHVEKCGIRYALTCTASTMGESNPPLQSVKCYFLSILLVAIALFVPFLSAPLPVKQWLGTSNIRHGRIETLPRLAPSSYRTDSRTRFENLSPSQQEGDGSMRNTVAVVLNWSRFQNVQRIVSLLCSPELDSIMKHVLVWNNNPKPVTYLVRHASLCFYWTFFRQTITRTLYRPLVQKKNYRLSTRRRICTSAHDF